MLFKIKFLIKIIFTDFKFVKSFIKNFFLLLFWHFKYKKNLNIICLTEHIGDIVACEPVTRHLLSKNIHAKNIWITYEKYLDLVKYNPNLYNTLSVTCISEWAILKHLLKSKLNIYDLHISRECPKYGFAIINSNEINYNNYLSHLNLLESFSASAGITDLNIKSSQFYINKNKLQKNLDFDSDYVIIHTKSNYSKKDWDINNWKWIVTYNSKIRFIEVGLEPIFDKNSAPQNYISYCKELNFIEIAHLIKNSKLYMGIDSGFAHIANCFEVPKIILMGELKNFSTYNPFNDSYNNSLHLIDKETNLKNLNVLMLRLWYDESGD